MFNEKIKNTHSECNETNNDEMKNSYKHCFNSEKIVEEILNKFDFEVYKVHWLNLKFEGFSIKRRIYSND